MRSKTQKEVRKRRGKPSSSPFNIYLRMVILIGILILVLARWLGSGTASIESGAVIGAIALIVFLFKFPKPKKETGEKVESKENLFQPEQKAFEQEEIFFSAEEKVIEPQRGFPLEEEKVIDLQECPESGQMSDPREVFPKEEEKGVNPQVFPEVREKVFDLRELLFESEEKEDLLEIDFKAGKGRKIINPQ